MNCFNVVAITVRFAAVAAWLHGCPHRRTSFPITLRTMPAADGRQNGQSETYIVCLECGRRFAYDWNAMRISAEPRGRAQKPSRGMDATEITHAQRL